VGTEQTAWAKVPRFGRWPLGQTTTSDVKAMRPEAGEVVDFRR